MPTKFKQRNGPGVSLAAFDVALNKLRRTRARFDLYADGQVSARAQWQTSMAMRRKTVNILIDATDNWVFDHVF